MSWTSSRARLFLACGFLIVVHGVRPALADPTPPGVASPAVPTVPAAPATASGNLINNGDFESIALTPACYFNLPNASVTGALFGVTAYGPAEEIDVMSDGSPCLFSLPPQSGLTKLAIHRQSAGVGGISDEFSFTLSGPITLGNVYTVTFYAVSHPYIDPDIGAVDIGLSSSPTSFGTSVFAGTPSTSAWTLLTHTFVAPVSAAYLTVRVVPDTQAWIHIDNFSLVSGGPTPVAAGTWGRLKTLYR